MSCTDDIHGKDQVVGTFQKVLEIRAKAFRAWVEESISIGITADECDWEDAYEAWREKVDSAVNHPPYSFMDYYRESQE